MSEFKHKCRRRHDRPQSAIVLAEDFMGAGSGGDGGSGNRFQHYDGWYSVGAGGISMCATGGVKTHARSPVLQLFAGSTDAPDGQVVVRGSQGVRITSGQEGVPSKNDDINGLEIQVTDPQDITIMRGTDPSASGEQIYMTSGWVDIHSGTGKITMQAADEITLTAGGGNSMIRMTPTGITIKGLITYIN
jgi:hypothetical protein